MTLLSITRGAATVAPYGTDTFAAHLAAREAVEPEPTPLLRVFVPGRPISVNSTHVKRAAASGRMRRDRVVEPLARGWREAIAYEVMQAARSGAAEMNWRRLRETKRPRLAISCIFIGSRADADNLLKLAVDGIKEGLMVDDRYVVRLYAEMQPLPRGGTRGAWIEVSVLPPPVKLTKPKRTRNAGRR